MGSAARRVDSSEAREVANENEPGIASPNWTVVELGPPNPKECSAVLRVLAKQLVRATLLELELCPSND